MEEFGIRISQQTFVVSADTKHFVIETSEAVTVWTVTARKLGHHPEYSVVGIMRQILYFVPSIQFGA
jgi:hypothetical protein